MELILERTEFADTYTHGILKMNGEKYCDTLEDAVRESGVKIPGQTAIPYGSYQIIINKSPKFERYLPRLLNVPGFEGVLIHRGNTDKDTAGCILVGIKEAPGKIINSAITENKLVAALQEVYNRNEPIKITII